MRVPDIISDLPLPPGERSSTLLAIRLAVRYLADHANCIELKDGRMIHSGLDCADYLNEFADALKLEAKKVSDEEKDCNRRGHLPPQRLPESPSSSRPVRPVTQDRARERRPPRLSGCNPAIREGFAARILSQRALPKSDEEDRMGYGVLPPNAGNTARD